MTEATTAATIEPKPEPKPPTLREAAAEVLLSGALLLSDVQRVNPSWNSEGVAKQTEERFRKALERVREALA